MRHAVAVLLQERLAANPVELGKRFFNRRGRLLADIDLDRIWEGAGRWVAIHRAALHGALREATAEVPVRLDTSVTGLEDGRTPRVSFADDSTGSYDLVVGADGVHSTYAASPWGGSRGQLRGTGVLAFRRRRLPRHHRLVVLLGRGCTFLTVALGEAAVYCYADLNAGDPAGAAGEDWRQSFADFADPVPRLLEQAAEAYFAPIEEVTPPA